jgi:protein SCO1
MPRFITRSQTFEAASLGPPTRRRAAGWIGAGAGLVLLAGCGPSDRWHALDVSGSSPPLALTMTRTSDGQQVTAADYRGRVVMLYFGYTFCPDICPTTLPTSPRSWIRSDRRRSRSGSCS